MDNAPEPPAPHDPGKTIGIVGFVFAFVGLSIVGLILSIIAFNKSKKAGYRNSLALAGIILNSVFTALALLVIPFLISITLVSYNAITDRANTSSSHAAAATAQKRSELYYAENNIYPETFSDIDTNSGIKVSPTPFLFEPTDAATVEFYSCGAEGNKIGYYDYTSNKVLYTYSGNADSYSNCVYAAS